MIAEAANGREASLLIQNKNPDVVLLDFQLPMLSGIETAREIADQQKGTKSIFISVLADEEYVLEAFKAGARGFVASESAQTDLLPAIRVVSEGGVFLSPLISSELINECNRRFSGEEETIHDPEKQLFCWLTEVVKEEDIANRLDTTVTVVQAASQNVRHRLQQVGMSETITSLL